MRSLLWILALTVLAACACTTALLVRQSADGAGGVETGAAPRKSREEVLDELREDAWRLVEELVECQASAATRLRAELSLLDCRKLEEALSSLARIPELLEAIGKDAGLDALYLVTDRGVFSPRDRGEPAAGFRVALTALLSSPECPQGIEALPVAVPEEATGLDPAGPELCLFASRRLRGSASQPHALLVACHTLRSLLETFTRAPGVDAGFSPEWHLVSAVAGEAPAIVAGARTGGAVRRSILRSLEIAPRSEEPGFAEIGPQVACWQALRSPGGRLLGALGATVSGGGMAAALEAASDPHAVPSAGSLFGDLAIATVAVLAGLVCLWGLLALWAKSVRERPSPATSAHSRDPRGRLQRGADGGGGTPAWARSLEAGLRGFEARLDHLSEIIEGASPDAARPDAARSPVGERLHGLEREWSARLEAFAKDVELARVRSQALAEDLDASRDEAAALREALEAAGQREGSLRQQLSGLGALQKAIVAGGLPLPLVAVDPKLKVFVWNAAAEALLGLGGAQALGRLLHEIHLPSPEIRDVLAKVSRQAMKARELRSWRGDCGGRGGSRLELAITAQPVVDAAGEALGAVLGLRDMTPQTELEGAVRRGQEWIDVLKDSLPVGLVLTDGGGRVAAWSRQAEALLGVGEKDALGQGLDSLATALADAAFQAKLRDPESREATRRHVILTGPESTQPDYLVTVAPLRAGVRGESGRLLLIEPLVKDEVAV